MGWTACARRIVAGAASDRPMYRDLAGADLVGQRPDGLLDRHGGVHAVLIVEVDVVDAQAPERLLERPAHRVRTTVGEILSDAELGGEYDVLTTAARERLADLDLRIAVDLGGVEEVDAQVQGAMDERDGGGVVADAAAVDIGDAEAHAAESDCGNRGPLAPERALLHVMHLGRAPGGVNRHQRQRRSAPYQALNFLCSFSRGRGILSPWPVVPARREFPGSVLP